MSRETSPFAVAPPTGNQERVISFLCDPATYGGVPVERISTHGAHIFLSGDKAYKLKRAVKFPFMDFSTVERRHRALEEEFAINRRSAPGVYLDVRPIRADPAGGSTFAGDGDVLDWILVMKRFPQEALLDNVAQSGGLNPSMMDKLGDAVIAMHRAAPRVDRDEAVYFLRTVADDLNSLRGHLADTQKVERLGELLSAACTGLAVHLNARVAAGYVRRCHGDLHLRNIVLIDDTPTLFDALEFDPDLASGDVYFDLAFLLMDLDHRGQRALAHRVFNRYINATADYDGLRGLAVFLSVRAAVRAKVAAIEATDTSLADVRTAKSALANEYLDLALGYLVEMPPTLIAIGGLSGSGKSTVALALAPVLRPEPGPVVIRSDVVRKRIAGVHETDRLPDGAYTTDMNEHVYREMADAARRILSAGHSVIIDAVFARAGERARVETIAQSVKCRFHGFWLDVPTSNRVARITGRAPDASDATPNIAQAQNSYETGDIKWHRLANTGGINETIAAIRQVCRS